MKDIFIINPHSFVDIITNSSTELFVCGKDKTLEMVKDLIIEYCPMLSEDSYSITTPSKQELFYLKHKDKFIKKPSTYSSSYWIPIDMLKEAQEA